MSLNALIIVLITVPILLPLLAPFISKLIFKLGAKQLSNSEFKKISSKKYPKFYDSLYALMALGIVVLPLCWVFFGIIFGPKLQLLIYGQDSLFFSYGPGYLFILILGFFAAICLLGSLTSAIFYVFSSPGYKLYLLYRQAKSGYNFSISSGINVFEKVGIGLFILLSPFLYLAFHDYQAIYPQKVVLNSLFNFSDKVYTFDQIQQVKAFAEGNYRSKNVDIFLTFQLKDGQEANHVDNEIVLAKPNLYNVLRDKDVAVEITKPSQSTIDLEYSCYAGYKNQIFATIFQLQDPTFTQVSCTKLK